MRPALRLKLSTEFANAARQDSNHPKLAELNAILQKYDVELKRTFNVYQECLAGTNDAYTHWPDSRQKLQDAVADQTNVNDWSSYDVFITKGASDLDRLGKGIRLEAELFQNPKFKDFVR
jgi:hypothetical protein